MDQRFSTVVVPATTHARLRVPEPGTLRVLKPLLHSLTKAALAEKRAQRYFSQRTKK